MNSNVNPTFYLQHPFVASRQNNNGDFRLCISRLLICIDPRICLPPGREVDSSSHQPEPGTRNLSQLFPFPCWDPGNDLIASCKSYISLYF